MRKLGTISKAAVAVTAIGVVATTAAACSSSAAKPEAKIASIPGGTTFVKLDATFAKDLTALKVTPSLIGPATLDSTTGTLGFPITGGNVTLYKKGQVNPYVQGVIDHQGSGFNLTAGGIKVGLQNFVIHPGKNSNLTGDVTANGASVVKGAKLFDLDGSTLQTPTIDSAGVATLTGTKVELSSAAAALLNKTFKITALKTDMLIGIATLKVNSK